MRRSRYYRNLANFADSNLGFTDRSKKARAPGINTVMIFSLPRSVAPTFIGFKVSCTAIALATRVT